jgi:hypothetical protein
MPQPPKELEHDDDPLFLAQVLRQNKPLADWRHIHADEALDIDLTGASAAETIQAVEKTTQVAFSVAATLFSASKVTQP